MISGGSYVVASRAFTQLVRIVSTVILARLLSPAEFGLIAMVLAITGFVTVFSDLGLSHATIQRDKINKTQVSNLFWINSAAGLAAMAILCLLSPVIAWFYNEPKLILIACTLSAAFIFAGFTVQHHSLLTRQLKFGSLAIVNIIAVVTSVCCGVIAAFMGAAVWSLVIMVLVETLARMVGVWIACSWRPAAFVRHTDIAALLKFGGNLTAFNITNYFSRNMDKVLIGWYWGAAALGLYSKAYSLLLLPIRQLTNPVATVAVPTLSRLQNDPARYRRYYLRAVSLIAFITMPAVMYLIIMSDQLIVLLLGEKWVKAADIFAVLGISALFQPVFNTAGWLFVSSGKTNKLFKWGIISSVAIVASFAAGLRFGPIAVAALYSTVIILLGFPALWYASRATSVDFKSIVTTILWPLTAVLPLGITLIGFKSAFGQINSNAVQLAAGLIITLFVYLGISSMHSAGMENIQEILSLIKKSISFKRYQLRPDLE